MPALENIEEIFEPTLGPQYCDYFYWLLVIYFVLAAVQLGDLGYALASNAKNLGNFMRTDMVHRLTHLVTILAQFVIVRIFYTICVKSMRR